jgi:hypothetical protein
MFTSMLHVHFHDSIVHVPLPKVGAILKISVDWNDTDVILPGESIDKAIVSLQIPEVLNDEAIQVLLHKKFESAKRLYR